MQVGIEGGELIQSETGENDLGVFTDDGGVTGNLDLFGSLGDGSGNDNDGVTSSGSLGELSIGGDSGGGSSSSSLGTTVGTGVTNVAGVGNSGALSDGSAVDNLVGGWGWSGSGECGQKTSRNN